MSATLYVPEHLATKPTSNGAMEEKTSAPKTEMGKLPKPTGWRILIMPYVPPKKSKGGIEIPDEAHAREQLATVVGYVLAVGPLAYKDRNKFGNPDDPHENWEPWCKEKDWVIFGRYDGSRFKIIDGELRFLNDDEILGVVEDPSYLVHT